MTQITAEKVKELRDKTQAGMMDCKKALTDSGGDMESAVKILREKGLSSAAKRADRTASQGVISIKSTEDGNTVAMFELNAETDFVARNEKFGALLNQLLDQVLVTKPKDINELENQPSINDNSKKVSDMVTDAIAVIGENIIARRFAIYDLAGGNITGDYIHMNGSIGVLVELAGTTGKELAKNIAMHIAASNPQYLDRKAVPAAVMDSEKEIYKQQAANEGKPQNILDKIADGKLNKFYQENCLLEQGYVKDPDKKISAILPQGAAIVRFTRFQLGA